MRRLNDNSNGNVQIIIMAIVAAIVLAVSIPIVFSVLSGINYTTIDAVWNTDVVGWAGTNGSMPARNASNALTTNLGTFYTISPIYLVVLAAVGIISAIMMIMVTRRQ